MASAQVMSSSAVSSGKQKHLEAGKRRLEEFRKKKAAARKAVSTSQSHLVSTVNDKLTSQNGQAHLFDSVGAVADGRTDSAAETSGFDHDVKSHGFTHDNGSESAPVANAYSESHNFMSSDLIQMQPEQVGISHDISSSKSETGFSYSRQTVRVGKFGADNGESNYADGISSAGLSVSQDDSSSYFRLNFNGAEVSDSNKDISSFDGPQDTNTSIKDMAAKDYAKGHATNLLYNDESDSAHLATTRHAADFGCSGHVGLDSKNQLMSGLEDRRPGNPVDKSSSLYGQQGSEPLVAGFNSDVSGSFNVPSYSALPETYPRRLRPSFLDSLNISRESLGSGQPYSEKEKLMTSKFPSSNFVASSSMLDHCTPSDPVEPLPTLVSPNPNTDFVGNTFSGQKLIEDSLESRLGSTFQKQNEDFAALEQHIEDLTQEKFSLRRTLEASKALAESLAAENSSLTESYNQQASIVNHLKDEMEKLQGEIKARLVELESFKAEYMNAQLECSAADERAKLLASEVIGLEEKALRLRSNELKLERELENSSAEIASYKKKVSSLEKERQDLLQTIDALREEKKLLQSKFRRASVGAVSIDIDKGRAKKDVSTSTNDIGLDSAGADGDNTEQVPSNALVHQGGDLLSLAQNRTAGFEDSAMSIPPDQMQMIQNINSLISEMMAEKEELMQALVSEISTSTQLKDLNKELSRKLEIQTQRLELLTAQSMANQNVPAKQPTGSLVVQEGVAYTDEGDEVVERVLGWIMKLFPGGPSKRRPSRL